MTVAARADIAKESIAMRWGIVHDLRGLAALEGEWNGLLGRSGADTIFMTWEWVQAWLAIAGGNIRPFIVTVRGEDDELVGIAPFYVTELRLMGAVSYKTLRIMGDDSTGAEYPDWIARRDMEKEVYRKIAGVLSENHEGWDCVWMPSAAGWTGAIERIQDACGHVGFYINTRPRDFGAFDLPVDIRDYHEKLSRNMRSQLGRQMKAVLAREGVEISRCGDPSELNGYLEALFDLHARRWERSGEPGSFIKKPFRVEFYRKFCAAAMENGWLRLFALKEAGEFKAVQIGYVYNNIFHQMQEGFDPDYLPGAGNVLRYKVIEALINEGVEAYDFLGEMTAHKRRWGAIKRIGHDVFIGRPCVRNHVLFTKRIWPSGRFMKQENIYRG